MSTAQHPTARAAQTLPALQFQRTDLPEVLELPGPLGVAAWNTAVRSYRPEAERAPYLLPMHPEAL